MNENSRSRKYTIHKSLWAIMAAVATILPVGIFQPDLNKPTKYCFGGHYFNS